MSFPRKPVSHIAQPKTAGTSPTRKMPVAPPVYRPQPVPRVLQRKTVGGQQPHADQSPRQPVAPPLYRPEQKKIVQPKIAAAQTPKLPQPPAVYRPQPTLGVLQTKESQTGNAARGHHNQTMRQGQQAAKSMRQSREVVQLRKGSGSHGKSAVVQPKKPFIRNGEIVFDATEEERERARNQPFPGVGRRLVDSAPVHRRPSSEDAVVVHNGSGSPPHPPSGGGLAATGRATGLSLHSMCSSALCNGTLVLTPQQVAGLRNSATQVPRPMPRNVFSVDPDYRESDISNRAITGIDHLIDLSPGLSSMDGRLTTSSRYRRHPKAINLSAALAQALGGLQRIIVAFPSAGGEVMYVITTDYQIIIGARSGRQRDLPHPTLIGGEDPEALSGGLVVFEGGRIKKVFINASGHFKPNAPSSIEVSLGLFTRLPASAFHEDFEGFEVFGTATPITIARRNPQSPVRPFDIHDIAEERGTIEPTCALSSQSAYNNISQIVDLNRSKLDWKRRLGNAKQALTKELAEDLSRISQFQSLFSREMSELYDGLRKRLEGIAALGMRFATLSQSPEFARLFLLLSLQFEKIKIARM